ncbi:MULTISPECIES: hypothetical protein [Pseudomonas]
MFSPAWSRIKEIEMVLVDRPYPVVYEHRGVKAKIDFEWDSDSDSVPTGLRIAVEIKERQVEAIRENAKYNSFNEALARGKALARLDIDLTLGPDLSA